MAGLPTSGALTMRSGEPFVLHVALRDGAGAPQLLSGRTFALIIARVGAAQAFLTQPATLSGDNLYAIVALTGIQTAALFVEFAARATAYGIVETTASGQVTIGSDVLHVAASGAFPSGAAPVAIDLPYVSAIPSTAGLIISQTGGRGLSAAEQFGIGGLDGGDPLTNAMFDALQAPALTAATIADVAAANADTKAALAQGVVDAQAANMAAIAGAVTATAADRQQTNLDQLATGADRVQTGQDVIATAGNKAASDADALATSIARGQAAASAQTALDAAGLAGAAVAIYANTAAGLAAVAEGAYFAVAGATGGPIYVTLYRETGGVAVYVNDFPSYSALATFLATIGATLVQNATDVAGHIRVDKYGGVIEEITPLGYRRTAYGEQRTDPSTWRLLFDEGAPDASTLTVTRNANGTVQVGLAGIYMTFDPAGAITVPGLALGNVIGGVTFTTSAGATALTNVAGGKIVIGADATSGQIGALQVTTYGATQVSVDKYGGVIEENYLDGTAVLPGGFYADGNAGKIYDRAGNQIAPYTGASSENFPAEYIARKNQAAELHAAALRARVVSPALYSGLGTKYTLFASYGQSNSCGTECFPLNYPANDKLFGRTLGCLMMGNSVHGASNVNAWSPIGTAAFNAMVATVKNTAGTGIITSAAIDALNGYADTNLGQTLAESALATLAFMRLQYLGLMSDPGRKLINYAAGVGGKMASELSKGFVNNYYNRLGQGATIAKGLADAEGANLIRMGGIIMSQGEDDASAGTDPATWKTLWRQIRADHHNDTTLGIFGQTGEPMVPMFTLQLGGVSNLPPNGQQIANAQLDMALSDSGFFLIGGTRGARKGTHYGTNTTVWNGMRIGKKMFELFCLGRVPFPFAPYEVECKGNQMLVTFQVPTPPIQFLSTYNNFSLVNPGDTTNKGFFPYDAGGDLTVTDVSIVASSTILITCNRAFGSTPKLDYGRRTGPMLGAGNLFDSSDFELLSDLYAAGTAWRTEEASAFYVNALFPGEEDVLLFTRSATAI